MSEYVNKPNKTKGYIFAFLALIVICSVYLLLISPYNDKFFRKICFQNERRINKSYDNLINLYDLLKVCISAAENGGKELVGSTKSFTIIRKRLTKNIPPFIKYTISADVDAYCAIFRTIKNSYPTIKMISRDHDADCIDRRNLSIYQRSSNNNKKFEEYVKAKDVTIWIESLDGLDEYKNKMYEHVTTMVCATIRGRPIIGVIHDPFRKSTSWAWVGKLISKDLTISQQKTSNNNYTKRIVTSTRSKDIKFIPNENLHDFELFREAGYGYKFKMLVKGEVEAYLEDDALTKWDICAGNAILDALGGQMTMINGYRINYSPYSNVVNQQGLIATLKNEYSLTKLNF